VWLQAGSPFPDTFYNSLCLGGQHHSVAEDAHWGPFLKTAFDYLRQTYPGPVQDSPQAQKLVAFLFGIAQHQVGVQKHW
jgi:glycosylphosphatidylinositol phospholipase D